MREKIMCQVTWASSNIPFYSHLLQSSLPPSSFFSYTSCANLFFPRSVPAPVEFHFCPCMDLDGITSGFMSCSGGESKTVNLSVFNWLIMILCNPHLWLSVSPGELGRSREGRSRTTEQNPTAQRNLFGIVCEGKGREQERDPNLSVY